MTSLIDSPHKYNFTHRVLYCLSVNYKINEVNIINDYITFLKKN